MALYMHGVRRRTDVNHNYQLQKALKHSTRAQKNETKKSWEHETDMEQWKHVPIHSIFATFLLNNISLFCVVIQPFNFITL